MIMTDPPVPADASALPAAAPGRPPPSEATEADELIITTITHEHADRVRSYELLAREWLR